MSAVSLAIVFDSAFHHGSGYGLSGLVDRAVLRDSNGIPYLAGSAIKGKLRHASVQVALAEERPICRIPGRPAACEESQRCIICSVFGSVRRQGGILFDDAYPSGPSWEFMRRIADPTSAGVYHRDSSVRISVSIDRMLGRARRSHLFSTETLPPELMFSASLVGEITEEHRVLLQRACRTITHFGSAGARGLGMCQFRLVEGQ
jgi:CRISPR/Cas system CSM-associated protein Csm3 (group 7 of RAMP superfamily)